MAKNNFNDFKSTLLDTFNFVAEKVLDLADTAADTAKSGHQIAKLVMEKRKEETAVQNAYNQLGKLYYDLHKEDAEGVFADLCNEIGSALDNIQDIEEEIAALKDSMGSDFDDIEVEFSEFFDDAEDADFESVVSDAETEATPEESAPVEEAPAEDVPVDEVPVADAPAEDTTADDTTEG